MSTQPTNPNRVPAGVRTGGQFSTGSRSEPVVSLGSPTDATTVYEVNYQVHSPGRDRRYPIMGMGRTRVTAASEAEARTVALAKVREQDPFARDSSMEIAIGDVNAEVAEQGTVTLTGYNLKRTLETQSRSSEHLQPGDVIFVAGDVIAGDLLGAPTIGVVEGVIVRKGSAPVATLRPLPRAPGQAFSGNFKSQVYLGERATVITDGSLVTDEVTARARTEATGLRGRAGADVWQRWVSAPDKARHTFLRSRGVHSNRVDDVDKQMRVILESEGISS